jgi:hypothetical protein
MASDIANIDGSQDGFSTAAQQIGSGSIKTNQELEQLLAEAYSMVDHPKRKRLFLYALYHAVPQSDYMQILRNYDELVWLVR